jgi:pimeloyl-ACP methyl ester carboxylesterase
MCIAIRAARIIRHRRTYHGAMTARRGKSFFIALALIVVFSTGCDGTSPESSSDPKAIAMESATGESEILIKPVTAKVRGLVLFMHGFDSSKDQILGQSLASTRDALLAAGFAIAASDSHGNNAGNAASLQDQVNLLDDAQAIVHTGDTFILAFSMGGLDALESAANHSIRDLRAVALLSPVCDQRPYLNQAGYDQAISTAFGGLTGQQLANAVKSFDPLQLPGSSFRGYAYLFWQSPADTVVAKTIQADAMVQRLRSASVDARELPLTGGHGNFTALHAADVLQLFQSSAAPH